MRILYNYRVRKQLKKCAKKQGNTVSELIQFYDSINPEYGKYLRKLAVEAHAI